MKIELASFLSCRASYNYSKKILYALNQYRELPPSAIQFCLRTKSHRSKMNSATYNMKSIS